jgi:hypothetical protein
MSLAPWLFTMTSSTSLSTCCDWLVRINNAKR